MSDNLRKYFAVKLPSPRPTFPYDMTVEEKNIMQKHSEFWRVLLNDGKAIVVGPVLDPKGTYGFGIVIADSIEEANLFLKDDPAQSISKYEIYPMLATLPVK